MLHWQSCILACPRVYSLRDRTRRSALQIWNTKYHPGALCTRLENTFEVVATVYTLQVHTAGAKEINNGTLHIRIIKVFNIIYVKIQTRAVSLKTGAVTFIKVTTLFLNRMISNVSLNFLISDILISITELELNDSELPVIAVISVFRAWGE